MTKEEKKLTSIVEVKEKLTPAKVELALKLGCPVQITEDQEPAWLVYKRGHFWEMKRIMPTMCYEVLIYRKELEGLSTEALVKWSVAIQNLQKELYEARIELEDELEENLYNITSKFCEEQKCFVQR